VHNGLRGIGYATRMVLPLFITCDALSFSHSIGSVNSPWNTIFIYERYLRGLGFTQKAYELLHEIMPAVLDNIRNCTCKDGCPCCVGKPLRQDTVWNVERGEGSIPSKAAALMILEGLMADEAALDCPDVLSLTDSEESSEARLEAALRRRLERMREPVVFHPIEPKVPTGYPDIEREEALPMADAARRDDRKREFNKELRKRIAKYQAAQLQPFSNEAVQPAPRIRPRGGGNPPTAFPGSPTPPIKEEAVVKKQPEVIQSGDALAAKARKLKKQRGEG
jgi:hypothetical protein